MLIRQSRKTFAPPQKVADNFDKLQKKIGIKFKNKSILKNAFTHRSYLNEHKNFKGPNNERLEFLGDAILSFVVSQFLYETLPQSPEGQLTQIRASLVRTETLAKISHSLKLGDYLLLSRGEEDSGGRNNNSILANTFEALIGAMFLDSGTETVEKFIKKTILDSWETLTKTAVSDNKSKLQEILQRKYKLSPNYKLISSWGPDHSREFEIGVYLGDKLLGTGVGKNKQAAAQSAARSAIESIVNQKT